MVSLIVFPICHLFCYFQTRNFVSKCFPNFLSLPPEQQWETTLSFAPHHRGIISDLSDIILAFSSHSNVKLKCSWEEEVGMQIQEESCEQATERIWSTTSCSCLGLIQFKVLYRVHFSESRLYKLYQEVEDGSPCHFSHMFFLCSGLEGFWAGYFTIMSTVLVNLQPCPLIAIFGIPDPSLAFNSAQKDIITFTSSLARRSFSLALYSALFCWSWRTLLPSAGEKKPQLLCIQWAHITLFSLYISQSVTFHCTHFTVCHWHLLNQQEVFY